MYRKSVISVVLVLFMFSLSFMGKTKSVCMQGLVPHLKFDENSGTMAHYSVGEVDGTLINSPIWTPGEVNNSLNFNGDSSELVIGLDKRLDTYFKVEELILSSGGELVNTVVMDTEVRAVVADVPYRTMSAFLSEVEVAGLSRYIEPHILFEVDFTPNDPDWPKQWGPHVIEADYAWNTTIGDPSVLVAVIDSGVDWDHPDLVANYVPLGYDWVNNDTDPMDDYGHGTHCAGIIGATINNSIGIAGLAQTQIIAEKGLGSNGRGWSTDLANGIIHAVDQGADILSCSWGSYLPSTLIHEAVKYAYNHSVLIIGSAGNSATYYKHYPSDFSEVVSVTATAASDTPAWFTNYGNHVEVAAPGVQVYSTILDDSYDNKSGTSMAAPHAAGVAALIWSQFPNMTRDQVRAQLRYTADDLGYSGFDPYYGYGRVNARRAVERDPLDHDLLISHLETLPCKSGSSSLINITVFNFGMENESDLTVQLLADGSLVNSTLISSLANMESGTVSFSWAPTVEGVYNVTSHVVPVPGETALENNALSASVSVRTSRVFRVPAEYTTIQAAINAAFSGFGDTIEVAAGTYYEHITVNKSVTIVGEDRSTTIIYGNENETVVSIGSDLIIRSRVYLIKGMNFSRFTIQGGIGTGRGVRVYYTYGNISDNIITNNSYGIYLYGCSGCTLRYNNITGNTFNFGVYGGPLIHFTHDIDVSNIVDGKPIYYLVNEHDKQIPSDAGYVAAVNSSNISVKDSTLTDNGQGVFFSHTTNSVIRNVTTSGNIEGILMENSDNNMMDRNNVTKNFESIHLYSSLNNAILQNHVVNNDRGINIVLSSHNTISENNITNNWAGGIGLTQSSLNTIFENDVSTGLFGIGFDEYSSNNSIYHNNLFNNTQQVLNLGSSNIWDNDCEGNYWSDYRGVDSDGDGIGDTPYTMLYDNIDRYPLMNLYWNPGDVDHDLDVDFFDVVTASNAYGSTPSDSNWNCHCDINEPYGKINIFDIVLMTQSYGEEYNP